NVHSVRIAARGRIADHDVRVLALDALTAVLSDTSEDPVNFVNARSVADARGLAVIEETDRNAGAFHDAVSITCVGEREVTATGTTLGHAARPWLVELLGFDIDLELDAELAVLEYADVPGMVGTIGTAFGDAGINIARL